MKAVVFHAIGSPLKIEDVPAPTLGTGEVIVDVVASSVLAYMGDVLSGVRKYPLALPCIPGAGCVGRVRAVGPDATKLAPGDWVFCDPTVRSRDDAITPDIMLQGLIAPTPGAMKLQKHFHDGSWAEQVRVPTENAIPIGPLEDANDAARWLAMGRFLVPFGGLLAIDFAAGETLLLSGATGAFGSAGVAVGLALGARAVIATGRDEKKLAELVHRFGPRVIPVAMKRDERDNSEALAHAAPGPIDCVLDILPPAASPAQVRAAVLAVRPGGRVALMGGVQDDVPLPYAWLMRNNVTLRGQWMYPPHAVTRMAAMIRAGLIDLDGFDIASFSLDTVTDAITHAATANGAFQMTVLKP